MEEHSKEVHLRCPTCGNTQFSFDENDLNKAIECPNCKRTITREELIQLNSKEIQNAVDEMKKDIIGDISKQFKGIFKGK
jgi:hypothetical protein